MMTQNCELFHVAENKKVCDEHIYHKYAFASTWKDLGTSMWKENGWRIVDGAIIPSSNIWGGWWSCLIDLVLQGSLFYFLCAIARRVSNSHSGVLISGNICWWSQTCNCPVGWRDDLYMTVQPVFLSATTCSLLLYTLSNIC